MLMISRRALIASGFATAAAGLAGGHVFASEPFFHVVEALRSLVRDDGLPFAGIRIAQNGEVLARAFIPGAEPVGPQSICRIYSMTKPVVAAGIVLLVEDGLLTLETPVADFVPELSGMRVITATPGETEPAQTMTVGHLLTHTCGLANSWGDARTAPLYREAGLIAGAWMYDPELGGLDGFAGRLGRVPLEAQPGSRWIYGYGLDIAGLVIERVSGERLGGFLQRRLFAPLGMNSTGFFVPEDRAGDLTGIYSMADGVRRRLPQGRARLPLVRPHADGGSAGLISTIDDYGRFADMLANGGTVGDTRVMTAQSVQLMMTPYGPQEHILPALQAFGMRGEPRQALGGVTWENDHAGPGSSGEFAWGGAAGTAFWSTPGTGLSVVLMTQLMGSGANTARDHLKPLIYQTLQGMR